MKAYKDCVCVCVCVWVCVCVCGSVDPCIHNLGAGWDERSASRPGRFSSPKESPVPIE
jgi:hypothetical protein